MKERPILFSAPMVNAILAGRKSQTRRIMKFQPDNNGKVAVGEIGDSRGVAYVGNETDGGHVTRVPCPYGQPGDRLWVRETWKYADWTDDGYPFIGYRVDDTKLLREKYPDDWADRLTDIWATLSEAENFNIDKRAADRRWRSSRFMPRWASRITLEVTGIRVERLREISEEDAKAEGVEYQDDEKDICHGWLSADRTVLFETARRAFENLWDSINDHDGKRWCDNPFVWRLEFRRVMQ